MTLIIQKSAEELRQREELDLTPPQGWIIPEEAQAILNNAPTDIESYRTSVINNLPLVTARAEELVAELEDRFSITVPITYLRIDEGTSFHILLLVERQDFLSPKIHAARILAEQFMHKDDEFDIHFIFSVRSENMLVDPITAQGYTLMYISENHETAA